MRRSSKKIFVFFTLFSLIGAQPVAAKTPAWKIEADIEFANTFIDHGMKTVESVEQFVEVFDQGLSGADREYLFQQWKGKKFPTIQKRGSLLTLIHNGETHTLEFVDPVKGRMKVNGKPFVIDVKAPLKMQTEVLYKYLKLQMKSSSIRRLIVPELHAAIQLPILGIVALLTRLGVIGARVVTHGATVKTAELVGSASIGAYMFTGQGPIRVIVCKLGVGGEKECVDDKGNPAKTDVVDQPGKPMNVEIGIEKCPDTANGSFKMYTKALRTGRKTEHVAETETVGNEVRIKKITETHSNFRGSEPVPPPMTYHLDDKGLKLVEWTDIRDGRPEKRKLDREFSKANSADNTSENRDRWKGFEGIKDLVEKTMALYCKKETKETVREPDGAARKATESN